MKRTLLRSLAIAGVFVVSLLAIVAAAEAKKPPKPPPEPPDGGEEYTATDLGTLGGSSSVAYAISEADHIVGESQPAGDPGSRAAFWEHDGQGWTITELPGLGGPDSRAEDVNTFGAVVGRAELPDGKGRAAMWVRTQGQWNVTDLGDLGGPGARARGINDAGQVVGASQVDATGPYHAALWQLVETQWQATALPEPAGYDRSAAYGISEDGLRVVGEVTSQPDGITHATLWQWADGAWTPQDLGVIDGQRSLAYAVNVAGEIIGESYVRRGLFTHGALWTVDEAGEVLELEDLGALKGCKMSRCLDLNDFPRAACQCNVAAVWEEATGMEDLNKKISENSGWGELTVARGINNAGNIVGNGLIAGQVHAFLLEPISQ